MSGGPSTKLNGLCEIDNLIPLNLMIFHEADSQHADCFFRFFLHELILQKAQQANHQPMEKGNSLRHE